MRVIPATDEAIGVAVRHTEPSPHLSLPLKPIFLVPVGGWLREGHP
jgi:hypothetical protein